MKSLKATDLLLNMILLLLFGILSFRDPAGYLFKTYFIIGGWQLLSMIVHRLYPGHFYLSASRKSYEKAVIAVFLFTALALLLLLVKQAAILMVLLYVMLVLAPVMALTYTVIGYAEYRKMLHREFIHLKN